MDEPWWDLRAEPTLAGQLEAELTKELPSGHILVGTQPKAIHDLRLVGGGACAPRNTAVNDGWPTTGALTRSDAELIGVASARPRRRDVISRHTSKGFLVRVP